MEASEPGERRQPPRRLLALVYTLREDGVRAEDLLLGTGLAAAALADPATRITHEQYLGACRNARALVPDPLLAWRLGARLRLADFGVYGLLLQTSASLRQVLWSAAAYQDLASPVVAFAPVDMAGDAGWAVSREAAAMLPPDLSAFLLEAQFAQWAAHLRELREDARPLLACFAHPAPAHRARYEAGLGCPCVYDAPRSELRVGAATLAWRPAMADAQACEALRMACDTHLADLRAVQGAVGQVQNVLGRLGDPGATMKAVASALRMTDRTLRRRLAAEGTTYSSLTDQLKCRLAIGHLTHSRSSVEEIAVMAGFSDPANFRRAFLRWTHVTPAQYRRGRQPALSGPEGPGPLRAAIGH